MCVAHWQQLGFESRHPAKYCTVHKVKIPRRRTGTWEQKQLYKKGIFKTAQYLVGFRSVTERGVDKQHLTQCQLESESWGRGWWWWWGWWQMQNMKLDANKSPHLLQQSTCRIKCCQTKQYLSLLQPPPNFYPYKLCSALLKSSRNVILNLPFFSSKFEKTFLPDMN